MGGGEGRGGRRWRRGGKRWRWEVPTNLIQLLFVSVADSSNGQRKRVKAKEKYNDYVLLHACMMRLYMSHACVV